MICVQFEHGMGSLDLVELDEPYLLLDESHVQNSMMFNVQVQLGNKLGNFISRLASIFSVTYSSLIKTNASLKYEFSLFLLLLQIGCVCNHKNFFLGDEDDADQMVAIIWLPHDGMMGRQSLLL